MHAYVFWMTISTRFCSIVRNHYELTFGENQFMKAFRILASILFLVFVALIILKSKEVTVYALDSFGIGWMTSYMFPRLLVVLMSIFVLMLLLPVLVIPRIGKVVVGFFILAACIGGYLAVNLPYITDWNKRGEDISMVDEGKAVEEFLRNNASYHGLVCLALPNCPYCVASIPKLEKLKNRSTDLQAMVLVVAKDSTGVERFRSHVGDTDIPIELAPDANAFAKLARGSFPTFVYIKDGKLVQLWANDQLGYPALDWIESGLE